MDEPKVLQTLLQPTVMMPSSRPESGLGGSCRSIDHFSTMEATWGLSTLRMRKPVMLTPQKRYGSRSMAIMSFIFFFFKGRDKNSREGRDSGLVCHRCFSRGWFNRRYIKTKEGGSSFQCQIRSFKCSLLNMRLCGWIEYKTAPSAAAAATLLLSPHLFHNQLHCATDKQLWFILFFILRFAFLKKSGELGVTRHCHCDDLMFWRRWDQWESFIFNNLEPRPSRRCVSAKNK